MRILYTESKAKNILKAAQRNRWLIVWLSALALSIFINKAEIQLIALSLITGAKWITCSKKNGINIFIGKRGEPWTRREPL